MAKSINSFIIPAQMAFEGECWYLNPKSIYRNGCYLHLFLIPQSEYVIHSTVTVSARLTGDSWTAHGFYGPPGFSLVRFKICSYIRDS